MDKTRARESEKERLKIHYLNNRDKFLERARKRRDEYPKENKEYYEKNKKELLLKKFKEAETPRGYLKGIYNRQLKQSKNRGHQKPEYTARDLIDRFENNPLFLKIHTEWINSGRNKWFAPSFDRIDNSKGYSFDNIRLMTWRENDQLFRQEWKIPVLVFKDNTLIGEYESFAEAKRKLGLCHQSKKGPFINSERKTKGFLVYSKKYYQENKVSKSA